ncbi:amino acid ABC transporter permease [Timonella sp. A28]|uniref:amino acid ABC transporter permease n=1 Tax=Timonella sp. A28 TaxID=3442640 RepID=UPI003EBEEEA5
MSPKQRARLSQVVQYGVLVVVALAIALVADWERISTNLFNVEVAADLLPQIPHAFLNTLTYTGASFAVALVLGILLALMRLSSVGLYRWLATAYVEFFRGIPAMLVVFSVAFALPIAFNVSIPSLTAKAALALGVVSSAYIAEVLRAGIQAVPNGQIEAARSLGMGHTRAMVTIVLPQAFRIVLPPMTNELILLTKDTSLIFLMGMTASQFELTKIGRDALNSGTGGLTGLFVVGFAYLCITIPLGILARHLEKRFGEGNRS